MHHAASQVSSTCHDEQDRLLWRDKTSSADRELVSFVLITDIVFVSDIIVSEIIIIDIMMIDIIIIVILICHEGSCQGVVTCQ